MVLAPGNDNRFSPITTTDHAGIVWILSLLAGVYSALTLFLRWHIKRRCFGWDDWAFVAASLVAFANFTTTYVGLCRDLGRSTSITILEPSVKYSASRLLYSGRILLVLALCLSKCSVVLLIKRLFSKDMTRHRMLCDTLLGIVVISGFGSILGLSINCDDTTLLAPMNGNCPRQANRWIAIGILDALSEIAIVLLSIVLVWRLQLMKQGLKATVVAAFAFRLPLVITAILNIHYISTYAHSPNPNLAIVPSLSIQQIHLLYSLVSATIPNLRGFLMRFDTGTMMNVGHKTGSSGAYGSSSDAEQNGFYPLGPYSQSGSGSASASRSRGESRGEEGSTEGEPVIGRLRPETGFVHNSAAWHSEDDIRVVREANLREGSKKDERDMRIKKDIRFTIQYNSRGVPL